MKSPFALISEYRAELMAMAMFGILTTHIKGNLGCAIVDRLCFMGVGGVDLFFLLSGFGLYYSMKKNPTTLQFYKKRLLRIFPTFIILLVVFLICNEKFSLKALFLGATTLPFWVKSWSKYMFAWFVSAIVLCYLIFPFYYKLFKKHALGSTIGGIGIGLVCCAIYSYIHFILRKPVNGGLILFYSRIPVFFIGVLFAQWAEKPFTKKQVNVTWIVSIVLSILSFAFYNFALEYFGYRAMRHTGGLFLLYIGILPGSMLAMSWIFKHCSKWILKTLQVLGGCTLEAYLLIGCTYPKVGILSDWTSVNLKVMKVLMVFFTIIIALITHYLISKGTQHIKTRYQK